MPEEFDYRNLPEGWTPADALTRAVQGEEISEAEKECATLLLAAQLLMQNGMEYDEATAYIDARNVGLYIKTVDDEIQFVITFENPKDEEESVPE